jgi:hypothetical protein
MTYQTCCGGISSDDPNVKEGSGPPYMFRNCFAAPSSEWSKTQCKNHCCSKDGGGPNGDLGSCVPTEDGGYCKYRDTYWKYDEQKEKYEIPRSDTRSLQEYPSDYGKVQHIDNLTIDKYYKKRLYDNTRAKVIQDMFNDSMNKRIQRTPNWTKQDKDKDKDKDKRGRSQSYDNKQARNQSSSIFQDVSLYQGIGFSIAIILSWILIAYLLAHTV